MLTKTNFKCVWFNSITKKYIVKILSQKIKYNKSFETDIQAAREHDLIKINKLGYKKTDKRLNFPENIKCKRKIQDISQNTLQCKRKKRSKNYRKKISNGTYQSILFNQNYRCNICEKVLGQSTEIDHALCIERYGNNEIKNHQVLCIPCHKWKSAYVDTNPMFISYINEMIFNKNNDDLFYINIVQKIKYMHSLNKCNCTCKLIKTPQKSILKKFINNIKYYASMISL